MHVINVRNVHEALPLGIHYICRNGIKRDSRAGEVLMAPVPVTTLYQRPDEMCCLWAERDVNPFATLFEGLWMLAGRNDVEYPARFIPRMREFSDDGKTLHGAYGARWRYKFGGDQLQLIADALKENPDCRRQVLQIWSSEDDLGQEGKDFPCNVTVHFQISVYGGLDMTVFNRSNDMVWGTYGADAPHFGMLLQYMAVAVGVPVGRYWQVSDNYHAYTKTLEPLMQLQAASRVEFAERVTPHSPYEAGQTSSMPMMAGLEPGKIEAWDNDLTMFMDVEDQAMGYETAFFKKVAVPMIRAHNAFKAYKGEDKYKIAAEEAKSIRAKDWRMMCEQWLHRRWEKFNASDQASQSG